MQKGNIKKGKKCNGIASAKKNSVNINMQTLSAFYIDYVIIIGNKIVIEKRPEFRYDSIVRHYTDLPYRITFWHKIVEVGERKTTIRVDFHDPCLPFFVEIFKIKTVSVRLLPTRNFRSESVRRKIKQEQKKFEV